MSAKTIQRQAEAKIAERQSLLRSASKSRSPIDDATGEDNEAGLGAAFLWVT